MLVCDLEYLAELWSLLLGVLSSRNHLRLLQVAERQPREGVGSLEGSCPRLCLTLETRWFGTSPGVTSLLWPSPAWGSLAWVGGWPPPPDDSLGAGGSALPPRAPRTVPGTRCRKGDEAALGCRAGMRGGRGWGAPPTPPSQGPTGHPACCGPACRRCCCGPAGVLWLEPDLRT